MKKKLIEYLILILIIIFSFLIRVINLDTVPPNVTGDEITHLSDIYRIVINKNFYLFDLVGDGSVGGASLLLPVSITNIFGIDNALLSLRLSTSIFSILALIPFYFIVKKRTNKFIGFLSTLLLSTNYVYLNFSRTGWIFIPLMVFLSLCLILYIEEINLKDKIIYYIILGLIAGLMFYGYFYGRFLVIFILFYLLLRAILKKNRVKNILKIGLFFLILILIAGPFLFKNLNNLPTMLQRANSVYIFSSNHKPSSFIPTLKNQIISTLRGNILLDSNVIGRGIENQRYSSQNISPLPLVVRLFFPLGLIYLLLNLKSQGFSLLLIVFMSILTIQAITDLPPNFARGLLFFPFAYLVSSIFTYFLWIKIKNFTKNNLIFKYVLIVSIILGSIITIKNDIFTYFSWIQSRDELQARKPAIDYQEFSDFQSLQIKKIKNDKHSINVYDWENLKK
ncbi:MAG: glycosyltransferase family 39 protein [Candidatus Levybacteria bacterium]|nr:glycosyltransferase family 39 protein [Candidatus Levybacteria bacterium]